MTQEKLIKKIHKFVKDNQLTPYLDTVALANDLASLFNKQLKERAKEILPKKQYFIGIKNPTHDINCHCNSCLPISFNEGWNACTDQMTNSLTKSEETE